MNLPENIVAIVEKYNRPGPRYTSYPTAPHFSENCDSQALIDACSNGTENASLYLHIPFCESNCWFCGCNTIITTRRKSADDYLTLLKKEIDLLNRDSSAKRKITQIHFGGGTPNFLSADQIHRLFEILNDGFEIAEKKEFSVELAPNYLSQEHVDAFIHHGLTRASFGVQDIDERVQKAINRVQSTETNHHAMDMLRTAGVKSVNIDLIYGLPYQSIDSYGRTIDAVFKLNPDRLAVFNYAHVPHMKPYQAKLEKHPLPTADNKIDLLLFIIKELGNGGYNYTGMDHFAKSDDELHIAQREKRLHRNFQGYTIQEEKELIALGVSSISETAYTYRQNTKSIPEYKALIEQETWPISRGIVLTEEDYARRAMIQSVMCNLSLDYNHFTSAYPQLFPEVLKAMTPKLPELEQDGLIQLHQKGFDVTDLGRLFLRNIAMIFDAYLGVGNAKFSKTV